jgi:DNA-binding GntR family transcriptional regulator
MGRVVQSTPNKFKPADVLRDLRGAIVRGEIPPSGRLATRRELVDRYQVSLSAVQQALNVLAKDGFVRAEAPWGLL